MKKQAGISLSEVLISLLLSSLIFTTLIQFYLSSKRHYLEAETLLATQLDLRWVSDLLSDSIRRAGFTPCMNIDQLELKKQGRRVHGLIIENEPQQLLQVNRMDEHFARVIEIKNSTQIFVSQDLVFNEKRLVLIADCEHAELQQITHVEMYPAGLLITLAHPLHFTYNNTTYVGQYIEERWLIQNNVQGKPALFYQLSQSEELTPLIQSLHSSRQYKHGKEFIKVVMGIATGSYRNINVVVRGS